MKQGSVHYKPEELHRLITKYDDIISLPAKRLQEEWDKWEYDSKAEVGAIMGGLDVEAIYQFYLSHIKILSTTNYVKSEPRTNSFLGIKWKSAPTITKIKGLENCALIGEALRIVNKTLPDKVKVIMLSHDSVHNSIPRFGYADEKNALLGGLLPVGKRAYHLADKGVHLNIKGAIPKPTKYQTYYQQATTTLSSLKQLTSLPDSEFVVLNDEQVDGLNEVVRIYKELTE